MSLLLIVGVILIAALIYVSRPLSLGLLVLLISLILTIFLGSSVSAWWGLILFLVYVGALLVLFMYVMAMSPNCFFSYPSKISKLGYSLMFLFSLTLSSAILFFNIFMPKFNVDFVETQKPTFLDSYYNITCLVSLSLVLLIAMVAVVYLLPGKNYGAPLRPFDQ